MESDVPYKFTGRIFNLGKVEDVGKGWGASFIRGDSISTFIEKLVGRNLR